MKKFTAVLLSVLLLFSCFAMAVSAADVPGVNPPTGLSFSQEGIADWDDVPGAAGYYVTLLEWDYDKENKQTWVWMPVVTLQVTEGSDVDLSEYMDFATYRFTVQSYIVTELIDGTQSTLKSEIAELDKDLKVEYVPQTDTGNFNIEIPNAEDWNAGSFTEFLKKVWQTLITVLSFLFYAGEKAGISFE